LLLWQLFGICSFSGFGFVERLYHISQKQRQAVQFNLSCCSQVADGAEHSEVRQLRDCRVNPMHRGESMQFKFLFAMVMAFALSLGAMAQQTDDGIKQDTKDAAHSTGRAAKKTGHKIKKGTKKVVHKSANATRKGAEKVEDKSEPKPTPPPQK
jgi:hypothetical protein